MSILGWTAPARAAAVGGGGQALPWESPLNSVLASFTGPVAKALCILAIVVIGFGFAFSEGGGMRRILGLLLGRVDRRHRNQLRRDLLRVRRRRGVVRRRSA